MGCLLNKVINKLVSKTIPQTNAIVEKITFYKLSKKIKFHVISSEIIPKSMVDTLIVDMKKAIPFIQYIDFSMHYKELAIEKKEVFEAYWKEVLYALNKKIPSASAWLRDVCFHLDDQTLILKVDNALGVENLKEKEVDLWIQKIFQSELNLMIKIVFEIEDAFSQEYKRTYLSEKEKETQTLIKDIFDDSSKKVSMKIKKEIGNKNGIIIGKAFHETIIPISNIREEVGTACIEGEVFDIDIKELKNGKILFILGITDYNSSIAVKLFAKKDQLDILSASLAKGKFLKIRGQVRYDTFSREIVIMAHDIIRGEPKLRTDSAEKKRIELHTHTQMSAMDGVTSASNLIKRAAEWGHHAIAITDHGVAQAFPEAMEAGKKNNIKIIYGIEGYLVNDGEPIVINSNDQSIDQCYVVFDIETTGLSSKHDKITEIGAVKIYKDQIIDRFSALVNPEIPIPSKIVELTGIKDDMVKNQPTIDHILPLFLSFIKDDPVVAHNAPFDVSFIKENCERLGLNFNPAIIDTLPLSKMLLPNLKRYRLNNIAQAMKVELKNHHRAVDDAEATAEIFIKLLRLLKDKGITRLNDINQLFVESINIKKLDTYHIIILAKNHVGLRNLYEVITKSHINYYHKKPRIPKSLLTQKRDGLIIGTACEAGELYKAILGNKSRREIENMVKFYDYLEIQPLANNYFLINKGLVKNEDELKNINRQIVQLGKKFNKPVVATGDVHFLDPKDEIYRRILMAGQGFQDADEQAPLYLKTTNEMLEEFEYLGRSVAADVVINNPNKIAGMIDPIIPIPEETFPPIIEGSEEELEKMCYKKAKKIYGDPLPEIVQQRLDRELHSIISNGYAVMYIIANKLVTKSLKDGYLVGSRGSVGSSFVATMSDITEVNPLPPHYICTNCKHSEFITDDSIGSGVDLPDKRCPVCHQMYKKDGHNIPFEVFLGFEGDKEPDIDLNFAGEYQSQAHKYTEELFGKGYVYRAGTIGTIADKTAYGFVKNYFEDRALPVNYREIIRLSKGCTGVKRTTGQHPGGVMVVPNYKNIFDFCPIQYPANDSSSGVITTHFDYHAISGRLLKLDILGHDVPTIIRMLQDITGVDPVSIPLDDQETIRIFTSPGPLAIQDKDFDCETGSLGIPEFGTKFVRQMLIDTKPTTFAELVRISGLSHGTDVWLNNAQDLVRQNIAGLKDVISTRDDIMNYLIYKGLPPKASFKIMEKVRKGKGLTSEDEEMMKKNDVPQWYINSCNHIKYMFPKAHAVAYVMMSFRIAYFKVHYPLAFYATYFTTKASDFDAELIVKGKESIKKKMKEIESLGNMASQKEKDLFTVLEVAYEMYCRGFHFLPVDIYQSDSDKFIVLQDALLPPLKALQGVGENAAKSICQSRKERSFISIEDLRERSKITKTVIETLQNHGCLTQLPDTNQLSLF